MVDKTGTGFVISASGHILTNQHVIDGCVGEIRGNLSGESPIALRVVSSDETNDLALLQGAGSSFKDVATIREKAIHPGDAVVAIGYPFHGLLTSDFTVTTGIVSSLSGILNDTRYLQISAAVQPGNSGGPLLDSGGNVVGMVAAKLNALKFAKATGDMPENINFAIKTGALRDFMDNSVVPYQTAEAKNDRKTADIARNARAYTLLISCTASEQTETAKN
jgi:S1-C subfamily serine protease